MLIIYHVMDNVQLINVVVQMDQLILVLQPTKKYRVVLVFIENILLQLFHVEILDVTMINVAIQQKKVYYLVVLMSLLQIIQHVKMHQLVQWDEFYDMMLEESIVHQVLEKMIVDQNFVALKQDQGKHVKIINVHLEKYDDQNHHEYHVMEIVGQKCVVVLMEQTTIVLIQ